MREADLDTIRHALEIARERGFGEVRLEIGELDFKAVLERGARNVGATPSGEQTAEGEPLAQEETLLDVVSPLVGFFRPPEPGLVVGAMLKTGDAVGAVVALGLANPVESMVEGEIVEVLVKAEDPVMYGQPLVRVKP